MTVGLYKLTKKRKDPQKINLYLGHIDREFGPLSKREKEGAIEETNNGFLTKKFILYPSIRTLSKKANYFLYKTSFQSKFIKKKSVGLDIANQREK